MGKPSRAASGRATVETARCLRCAIYTPRADLLFTSTGNPYCLSCGLPSGFSVPPPITPSPPPSHSRIDPMDEWVREGAGAGPLEQRVRIAAALMLLATLLFPIAACVSQL